MIEISKLKMAKEAALNLNLFEKTAYNAYGIYPQEAYSQGGQYPGAPDAPRFMSPLVQGLGGLGIAGMGAYSLLKSTPQILASPVKPRSTDLEAALAMLLASGAGYGLKHWKDKGKPAASEALSEALSAATPVATPAATFQVGPTETFYNEFSPSAAGPAEKATGPARGATRLPRRARDAAHRSAAAARRAAGSGGGGKPLTKATNFASSSTALHKMKRLQQMGVLPEVYKASPALLGVTDTGAELITALKSKKSKNFGVRKPSINEMRAAEAFADKLRVGAQVFGRNRNAARALLK